MVVIVDWMVGSMENIERDSAAIQYRYMYIVCLSCDQCGTKYCVPDIWRLQLLPWQDPLLTSCNPYKYAQDLGSVPPQKIFFFYSS